MAEEAKTYVFGNDSSMMSALAPLMQSRGVDPSVLAMMNNGGFGGNNQWIWVIFLFFLMGWGGNGFGGSRDGLASQINNDYGRELLSQGINGNRQAISDLATNLNYSVGQVQNAINALNNSTQQIGNQVGLSSQQVINAIQNGNCQLAGKLSEYFCDNRLLITNQGYENRISVAENAAMLAGKIDQQTNLLNDKFCQLEKRELTNRIDELIAINSQLQGQIDNAQQTADITNYINSLVTPLKHTVDTIKLSQPATVTLPTNQYTAVPSYPAAFPNVYGCNNYGSIWS